MKSGTFAALALAGASPLLGQAAPTVVGVDLSRATPLQGSWTYAPVADGSEASFRDSAGRVQLTVHCTRATRRVTLSKPASGAAPHLFVWTSSLSRSIPASFQPATGRIVAQVAAFDGLLDALTFSRGRFGVRVAGTPALVLPAWAEASRVVEDCRT